MAEHKTFWKEFWRTVKYFLIAASAGLIQFGVCTICDELIFRSLNHSLYWMFYFIALVLSVLWNFTINRKVTFKSVGNVPIAMLKVLGYYCVYTPLSLQFAWVAQNKWGIPEVVITIINILINGVTEYLFMRLFVFRKEIDSALKEQVKDENLPEHISNILIEGGFEENSFKVTTENGEFFVDFNDDIKCAKKASKLLKNDFLKCSIDRNDEIYFIRIIRR